MKLLLVAAAGQGQEMLPAAEQEVVDIQGSVPESKRLNNAGPEDVAGAGEYPWFHFSGHADPQLKSKSGYQFHGRVLIWFKDGKRQALDEQTLAAVLVNKVKVRVALLNGCKSSSLGERLAERGVHVVCWSTLLLDSAARYFGKAFWSNMALLPDSGVDEYTLRDAVRNAFDAARLAVRTIMGAPGTVTIAAATTYLASGESKRQRGGAASVETARYSLADPEQPREANEGEAVGVPELLSRLPDHFVQGRVPELPAEFVSRADHPVLRSSLISSAKDPAVFAAVHVITGTSVTGIAGAAGLGKSTAATWLARDTRVQTAFHGGVIWLQLDQAADKTERLRRFAKLVGVGHEDVQGANVDDLRELVPNKLKERSFDGKPRPCLLVLDDVWQVEQVRPFRGLADSLTVLVTTRRLGIVEKLGQHLAPLPTLKPLPDDEAFTLLETMSEGKVRSDDRRDLLCHLLKRCSGLPSMVRAVGMLLRKRSVEDLLESIKRHQARSMPGSNTAGHDYGNHFAILGEQLECIAREVGDCGVCDVHMLAAFREDDLIPVDILGVLWRGSGDANMDAEALQRRVELLADCSLLTYDSAEGTVQLIDVVRDYLGSCANDATQAKWHSQLLCESGVQHVGVPGLDSDAGGYRFGAYTAENYWRQEIGKRRFCHHLIEALGGCKLPLLETARPLGGAIASRLTELDLSDVLLEYPQLTALPASLACLSKLRRLDLSGGQFVRLPELSSSFGKLTSLTELILRDCSLLEALPETCSTLTMLRKLDLRSCSRLRSVPESVPLLTSLRELLYTDCEGLLKDSAFKAAVEDRRRADATKWEYLRLKATTNDDDDDDDDF